MTKRSSTKTTKHDQRVEELTADLQRVQADFENYRKRIDDEKESARILGRMQAINALLPVIDNIERAIAHRPADLVGNAWADGVASLVKNLEKSLESLHLKRIIATQGSHFDPSIHEAVQFDDGAEGEHEIIAEELQAGYYLDANVLRPAIVKVTRK